MKRPRGVTIIGCLLLAQGLLGIVVVALAIAVGALALAQWSPGQPLPSLGATSAINWIGVIAYALVAVLALVGGVALLMMQPWAWTVAMLLQGYTLVLNLWSFFQGTPLYLQMLLTVVIVFYLNTRDVYGAFQARRHLENEPLPDAFDTLSTATTLGATAATVERPRAKGGDTETSAMPISEESGHYRNGKSIA